MSAELAKSEDRVRGLRHNLKVIESELKQIDEAECSLAAWDRISLALEFAETAAQEEK